MDDKKINGLYESILSRLNVKENPAKEDLLSNYLQMLLLQKLITLADAFVQFIAVDKVVELLRTTADTLEIIDRETDDKG